MKRTARLKLRKIGPMYMVVDGVTGEARMTNVYQLNETAAAVWEFMGEREVSQTELVDFLTERYEVDAATALSDIKALMDDWREFGLIEA